MSHYEVLGLHQPGTDTRGTWNQDLKLAYRQALLKHHPDKASSNSSTPRAHPTQSTPSKTLPSGGGSKPTVDEITTAYQTLLDPKARAEYDRSLLLQPQDAGGDHKKYHTGLDTVDLDDLGFDTAAEVWYRACRCGQERGYVVTERQLEEVADLGEIYVGCHGCSLWLKVLFGTADADG